MRRVVLVLELADDEADLVADAVSQTAVRFAGMPLSEALAISRGGLRVPKDGNEVTHVRSDGALYLDGTPLNVESILRRT